MERVGFIGVGVMGKPMCLNLRKAGFPLTVYARRPEAADAVVAAGATRVESSRAVAEVVDVVITMLPDSPQVEEVVLGPGGVLEGARAGMAVVDMSTIAPAASKRVAAACAERGVAFLDAPVSGGSQGAEAGTLTIMVGRRGGDVRAPASDLRGHGRGREHPARRPGRRGRGGKAGQPAPLRRHRGGHAGGAGAGGQGRRRRGDDGARRRGQQWRELAVGQPDPAARLQRYLRARLLHRPAGQRPAAGRGVGRSSSTCR